MSQQASITLNTVVYDPNGYDAPKGLWSWVNRAGGILNSFSTLTRLFRSGTGAQKLQKISYLIEVPVVATADTTCSCAGALLRTNLVKVEFSLSPNSTAAERTDIRLRMKDLLLSAEAIAAVDNLSPSY